MTAALVSVWRELYSLSACAFTAFGFAAFLLHLRGEARAEPKKIYRFGKWGHGGFESPIPHRCLNKKRRLFKTIADYQAIFAAFELRLH